MIHECFRVIDMTGGILNLCPLIRFAAPIMYYSSTFYFISRLSSIADWHFSRFCFNICRSGYEPLLDAHKPLWNFLKEVISEIRVNQSVNKSKSFIGAYLDELSSRCKGDEVHDSFSGKHLYNRYFILIISIENKKKMEKFLCRRSIVISMFGFFSSWH